MKLSLAIAILSAGISGLVDGQAKAATILAPGAFTSLGPLPSGDLSIDTDSVTLAYSGGTLFGTVVSQVGGPVSNEIPNIAVFTFDGGSTLAATDTILILNDFADGNNTRAVALLFQGSAALSGTIDGFSGKNGHFNDGQLSGPNPDDDGKGGPGGPGGFRGNSGSYNSSPNFPDGHHGRPGMGPGGGAGGGDAADAGAGGGSRGVGGPGLAAGSEPGGAAGLAANDLANLPLRGGSGGAGGGTATLMGASGGGGGGGALELVSLGLLDLSGLRMDLSGGDGGVRSPAASPLSSDSTGGGGGGGGGTLLTSSASLTLSSSTLIDLSGGVGSGRSGSGGGGEFLGFISPTGTFTAPSGALTDPGFIFDVTASGGAGAGTKAVAAVPEPTTGTLLLLALLMVCGREWQRRRGKMC